MKESGIFLMSGDYDIGINLCIGKLQRSCYNNDKYDNNEAIPQPTNMIITG